MKVVSLSAKLLILALLLAATVWQGERFLEKRSLAFHQTEPTLDLNETSGVVAVEPRKYNLRHAKAQGNFIAGKKILKYYNKDYYYVLTPFKLTDQKYTVLVCHGLVKKELIENFVFEAKELHVTGLLYFFKTWLPDMHDGKSDIWYQLDFEKIGKFYDLPNLQSFIIWQDGEPAELAPKPKLKINNYHIWYFLMWLSLAIAWGVIMFMPAPKKGMYDRSP